MKTHIFHLQIIPIKNIISHEEFDLKRTGPLVDKLKEEGHLANPVLVASLGKGKYLQLDGMNRISSFIIMKIPNILVQIVDYNDQEAVDLSSWIHLFSSPQEDFLKHLKKLGCDVRSSNISQVGYRYIREEGVGRICSLIDKNKQVKTIYANGNLPEKVSLLRKIVSYYKDHIIRDVLPYQVYEGDIDLIFKTHTDTDKILVFPTFTRHQIIDVVKKGLIFPSGMTRHIIRKRCLNVNIPLMFFSQKKTLETLNMELEKKLLKRAFRVYEESTIFFE